MIKVKICGITNLEDALLASSCGAEALGFIFSKKSPRCIKRKEAKRIICQLDPFIVKVGVFLNHQRKEVSDIASYLGLDVLQFHGQESPSYCHFFRPKFKVIKVLFCEDSPFKDKIFRYNVDAFLFDVKYEQKTRGIKKLPLNILNEIATFIKRGERIIISGGLNIENVDKIKKFEPYAVDVASGVEKNIGKKDKRLVEMFIRRVKDEST